MFHNLNQGIMEKHFKYFSVISVRCVQSFTNITITKPRKHFNFLIKVMMSLMKNSYIFQQTDNRLLKKLFSLVIHLINFIICVITAFAYMCKKNGIGQK